MRLRVFAAYVRKARDTLGARERAAAVRLLLANVVSGLVDAFGLGVLFMLVVTVLAPSGSVLKDLIFGAMGRLGVTEEHSVVKILLVLILAVYASKTALQIAITRYKSRLVFGQHEILTQRLLSSYLYKPWRFYLDNNTSVLTNHLQNNLNYVMRCFYLPMAQILSDIVILTVLFSFLTFLSAGVSLFLAAFLGAAMFLSVGLLRGRLERLGRRRYENETELARLFDGGLSGIKELTLSGTRETFLNRTMTLVKAARDDDARIQVYEETPRYIIEFALVAGFLTFLVTMAALGMAVSTIASVAVIFGAATFRILPCLNRMNGYAAILMGAVPTFDNLYPELVVPERPRGSATPVPPLDFEEAIHVDGVSFAYDSAKGDILRNISLTIPKGDWIGIVGSTGAGKTTLVEIVVGLLTPTAGAIRIDGAALDDETVVAAWQRRIGYVPQNTFLYDDTILNNIAFGLPPHLIDAERVREAARLAQIADFIETELESGYQTMIGEGGIRMSGGQRQRIGIARALYRDTDVLVLDEATSALDTETEAKVNAAIAGLSKTRTIITITHRVQSLAACDQIFLLREGRVAQTGTFAELRDRGVALFAPEPPAAQSHKAREKRPDGRQAKPVA